MRDYALTWPRLVAQLRATGADDVTLGRYRNVYETCQQVFHGFHRGNGEPFECHMIRSASVALAEGQPDHVAFAALLHSAYDLYSYDDSTRRPPRDAHRQWLRQRIGPDAEALVWSFHLLDWRGEMDHQLAGLSGATPAERQVLLLYLANELVNHLDLGKAYRDPWPYLERIEQHGDTIVEIARAMEMPVLADELATVLKEHLDDEVPAPALGRTRPYEISGRRPFQMAPARHLYVRTRPVRGQLVRLGRRVGGGPRPIRSLGDDAQLRPHVSAAPR